MAIQSLNNDLLGVIYEGIIKKQTFNQIHKDLVYITKLEGKYGKSSLKVATRITRQLTKKVKKEKIVDLDALALFAFTFFTKNDCYHEMLSCSYKEAQEFEKEQKRKIIDKSLELAKKETQFELDKKIFYLASKHGDCAVDHKDYQAKLYIDKRWKSFIKSKDLREQIELFIKKNNILFFQDIIEAPVWLFTRPNCRHFFEQLSVDETLDKSIKELLKKYDMISDTGYKHTQTIYHPHGKYRISNIENIIEKYQQRLAYHKKLYSIHRIETIRHAIEKDKFLIEKWQNYLQNKK